jgi:hypothetical protein
VTSHLEFGGLALDWFPCDAPSSLERADLEWQPRGSIGSNAGRGDQRFTEIDEVYVDESFTSINEHPIEIVVHAINAKAFGLHRGRIGGAVCGRDRYVEIFVLTRLMAEQRIDPPATIQPDIDAVLFEPVE